MKRIKESFRLNGLQYTLIKRNENVALYGISGTYTDKVISYEVDIIYFRNDQYGEREAIATNEVFGRDRSRSFNNEQKAQEYYNELTTELTKERKLYQGVPEVVSGVEQNVEMVPQYH